MLDTPEIAQTSDDRQLRPLKRGLSRFASMYSPILPMHASNAVETDQDLMPEHTSDLKSTDDVKMPHLPQLHIQNDEDKPLEVDRNQVCHDTFQYKYFKKPGEGGTHLSNNHKKKRNEGAYIKLTRCLLAAHACTQFQREYFNAENMEHQEINTKYRYEENRMSKISCSGNLKKSVSRKLSAKKSI